MSLTPSNMIELGSAAPRFTLPDTISGENFSLQDLQSNIGTVIMFICNHCPYVVHIQKVLAEVAQQYQKKGIQFIAINSNDVDNYPDDSPEKMSIIAKEVGYSFPYLFDATQEVAKSFDAACTPDFFVYNKDMKLVYRGQFDSARPGNDVPVTGADLKVALDAVIANQAVPNDQKPSTGCNIKWK